MRPTIFADVTPDMAIRRAESFGPVLSVAPFDSEDETIGNANDTEHGLAALLHSTDAERCKCVFRQLRAGMVEINGLFIVPGAPFDGMNQSGNGREGGVFGIANFMEIKNISGWPT